MSWGQKYLIPGALFICSSTVFATSPQWIIDSKESTLKFSATQNDSPVVGEFKSFNGEIFADAANYKEGSIHIVVQMGSLYASYGELVTTLSTPEWFNIKAFPTADFKSTEIKKTGDKSYQAAGTLTIKDKTQPITLTFTTGQLTADKALVQGSTIIKRTAFGVGQGEWSSTSEVKDDVTVNFTISATKKP